MESPASEYPYKYEIPREDGFQETLIRLFRKAGLDTRGFPKSWDEDIPFDNGVFVVRPYDWDAYCTCGLDDEIDEWWDEKEHTPECYQNVLREREIEAGVHISTPYDLRPANATEKLHEICVDTAREYGFPEIGCALHCSCGLDDEFEATFKDKYHDEDCHVVLPNFYHYRTGLKVQWYKYPLRDSYMNIDLDEEQWKEIIDECLQSLS